MHSGHFRRGRHRAPRRTHYRATTAVLTLAAAGSLAFAGPAGAAPDSVWDQVAQCESGGRWSVDTGNGYHGGLQFAPSTWRGFGGGEFASLASGASRAEQIVVAERVLAAQGWGAWPSCSRKTGARGTAANVRTPVSRDADEPATPDGRLPAGFRVKPGDTLGGIAGRFGIPGGASSLAARNNIPDPDVIAVGTRLR